MLLLEEGEEKTREMVDEAGEEVTQVVKKGMATQTVAAELDRLVAGRAFWMVFSGKAGSDSDRSSRAVRARCAARRRARGNCC